MTVDEFRNYLLDISVFEDEEDEQQCKLLAQVRDKLEKAESISKIFSSVREWASFLNDDIFQCIIERYDIRKDCESMKYSEHLYEYLLKHELSHFTKINPRPEKLEQMKKGKLEETSEKTLTLKVNSERLRRIAHVVNLKRTIATILGMKVSALQLIDIREGCVEITFRVPALAPGLLSLSPVQLKQFQDLSIERMKCGEHEVNFRQDASELEGASSRENASKRGISVTLNKLITSLMSRKRELKDIGSWVHLVKALECIGHVEIASIVRKGELL